MCVKYHRHVAHQQSAPGGDFDRSIAVNDEAVALEGSSANNSDEK
jgi:hypothetical protein